MSGCYETHDFAAETTINGIMSSMNHDGDERMERTKNINRQ